MHLSIMKLIIITFLLSNGPVSGSPSPSPSLWVSLTIIDEIIVLLPLPPGLSDRLDHEIALPAQSAHPAVLHWEPRSRSGLCASGVQRSSWPHPAPTRRTSRDWTHGKLDRGHPEVGHHACPGFPPRECTRGVLR